VETFIPWPLYYGRSPLYTLYFRMRPMPNMDAMERKISCPCKKLKH